MLNTDGRCTKWGLIKVPGLKRSVSNGSKFSLEVTFPSKDTSLHFLYKQIHKHNDVKGTKSSPKGLFQSTSFDPNFSKFFDQVKSICQTLGSIVEREDRVLKPPEPIYLIGDIHGNLEDLLTLEKTLWRSTPFLTANYLFLGDFVDRGKWGFECFLYLAVAKLLNPNKVFLLRGNHELRNIQRKYSFYKELETKYGQGYGQKIFDLLNFVFDRLPFCATINRSIYAAHGGIPFSNIDLENLNKVTPHIVSDPEKQAPSEWEILWSDPQKYSEWPKIAQEQSVAISTTSRNYMYLQNKKRGTAFFFNEYAIQQFLRANGLQFVIRAHEVPVDGFKFDLGKLCTTIFSCSHYCNNSNDCATMLIGREGRMRVIRIDTSKNKPAM